MSQSDGLRALTGRLVGPPNIAQDTNMISTLAVIGVIVGGVSGLASLALILRFLWRVYDRGGRTDLAAAAKALREVHDPNWAAKLSRFLPYSSNGEDTDKVGNLDDDPESPTPLAA